MKQEIPTVKTVTQEEYRQRAVERHLPQDVRDKPSDYTVREVAAQGAHADEAYANDYLMRADQVSRPRALPVISKIFPRFVTIEMQPLSLDARPIDHPPKQYHLDPKGFLRQRSRFFAKVWNPQIGYIKKTRGRWDESFGKLLEPDSDTPQDRPLARH